MINEKIKKRSVYTLPRQEYYNTFNIKIQKENRKMEKEEVLKLDYIQISDEYTIATIVYQNDEVLKRYSFNDNELGVTSNRNPEFKYPSLFIRGYKTESDNKPIIIPNEHLKFVKDKVKKINEKYGVPTK